MAEGLLRHEAGDRFDVFSAATKPSHVQPEAIAEIGIDISGLARSRSMSSLGRSSITSSRSSTTLRKRVPFFRAKQGTYIGALMIPQRCKDRTKSGKPFRRIRGELQDRISAFLWARPDLHSIRKMKA